MQCRYSSICYDSLVKKYILKCKITEFRNYKNLNHQKTSIQKFRKFWKQNRIKKEFLEKNRTFSRFSRGCLLLSNLRIYSPVRYNRLEKWYYIHHWKFSKIKANIFGVGKVAILNWNQEILRAIWMSTLSFTIKADIIFFPYFEHASNIWGCYLVRLHHSAP